MPEVHVGSGATITGAATMKNNTRVNGMDEIRKKRSQITTDWDAGGLGGEATARQVVRTDLRQRLDRP